MCDTKITSIHKSIVQGTDRIVKFIGLNLDKVSHIDLISSFATMEWQLEDNNTIIITLNAPQPETISFTVLINDDDDLRLKSDGTALEVKILPGPQITYWPDQIKVGNCRSLTVNGRNLTQDGISFPSDWDSLSVADQKKFLIECLDKNQLYVNLSEVEDKEYGVSKEDQKLNKEFYGN